MPVLSYLGELFLHMDWADARMWAAVTASTRAIADTELQNRITHLHSTQRGFLHAWRGLPPFDPRSASFPDLAVLLHWGREGIEQMKEYLASLGEGDLEKTLIVPWAKMIEERTGRKLAPTTLGETLFQAVMHSAHHRAQVSTALRALGATPPRIDFIVWVWEGKPQAQWAPQ